MQLSTVVWFFLAKPQAIVCMAFLYCHYHRKHSTVQSCFSQNVKWRPVYVSNGYELCSDILFTRVLTFDPLISVIMADCYVVKPHCQLFFEGYRPPGCWKRHGLSVFSRILHCLNQPSFPLCNKVLRGICVCLGC
jgi:hypothetical protein